MLELGKGFLFEGRQRRITLPGRQFSSMRTMVWSERFIPSKDFKNYNTARSQKLNIASGEPRWLYMLHQNILAMKILFLVKNG